MNYLTNYLDLGWPIFGFLTLLFWVVIPQWVKYNTRFFEQFLGWVIAINYLAYHVMALGSGEWSLAKSLPLHMCNMTQILLFMHLVFRVQWAFPIAAFWGPLGGIQAIFTPGLDISASWYQCTQFFVSHSLVVLVPLFLILFSGRKIPKNFTWKIFGLTNAVAFVLYFVNLLTGGNYMYVNQPPPVDHPLVQGVWPDYLLVFEIALLLLAAGYSWLLRKYTLEISAEEKN